MEKVFDKKEVELRKLKKGIKVSNAFNHFIDIRDISRGSIIVDAGACWADFIHALKKFKTGTRVIAIEPNRDNVKKLQNKEFKDGEIYEKALVGDNWPDKVKFIQVLGKKGWGNIIGNTHQGRRNVEGIKEYYVETIKINNIFRVLGIERIDHLKMDIEGAEVDVMETMTEEAASKIGQITMEVHTILNKKAFIPRMKDRLEELGYQTKVAGKRKEVFGKRREVDW